MKSLARIACLCLLAVGASSAQAAAPPSPLKVTLTPAFAGGMYPCPMYMDQMIQLKAQITGGYQGSLLGPLAWVTRYSFYAGRGEGGGKIIKENTPEAMVWWQATNLGHYTFSVTVKQIQGGSVAQATAETPICEVKTAPLQVTLNVSPSSGQAVAPPQNVAGMMTLTATVSNGFQNGMNRFTYSYRNLDTNREKVTIVTRPVNVIEPFRPFNPPEPVDPGTYMINVGVETYRTSPQGDIIMGVGGKSIQDYRVMAAKALGTVPIRSGVDIARTPSTPPSATSQVSLNVTPLSPSPSTGPIALTAAVAVPGNPTGVTNKFTFSYAGSGGVPSASPILPTSGGSQSWTLSPQPPPGTYTLTASVETRRTADNTVVAQGSAQIPNYVVAGPTYPYGWLFPVTTQNTTLAVGTPYGSASNTIAGNSLNAIVNSQQVRVRADNTACASCHGGSFTQSGFCSSASNYLTKGPHSTSGQPADQILNSLFSNWKTRNCPN